MLKLLSVLTWLKVVSNVCTTVLAKEFSIDYFGIRDLS